MVNGFTNNFLPRFNAAGGLIASNVFADGTNVGIGTNSPATRLHVNGSIRQTGFLSAIPFSNADGTLVAATGANIATVLGSAASANYIQNQNAAAQTGNAWVNGQLRGAVILGNLGSAAAPSYSFAGDLNNGIYSPSADAVAITTGGAERLRVDNLGRIGIGTISPTNNLEVIDATGVTFRSTQSVNTQNSFRIFGGAFSGNKVTTLFFNSGETFNQINYGGGTSLAEPATIHQWFIGTLGSNSAGTSSMYLNSNGLGLLTSNPQTRLDVRGQVSASLGSAANPTYAFVGDLNTGAFSPSADTYAIATNGLQRINVDNVGRVAIGTNATAVASAALEIVSTTQGFLPPRMTTAQITAIASPANGLMVYNTTLNKICVFENGTWRQVSTTNM
jgi:hypothetical protein